MFKLNIFWLSVFSITCLMGFPLIIVCTFLLGLFFTNRKISYCLLGLIVSIFSQTRLNYYREFLDYKPDLAGTWVVVESEGKEFQQQLVLEKGVTKVLAKIAKYPRIYPSSKVKLNGELAKLDLGDPFQRSYIVNGISWEVKAPYPEVIIAANASNDYCTNLKPIYAYELGQFLCGVVIGKYELRAENIQLFKDLGITHVLSVSGYNVTLVATLLLGFSGRINRRKLYRLIPICLLIYLQIVGSDNVPAARAVIMALVTILATATGRPTAIWLAILYTNLVFFWVNPLIYLSISWQLSLSALLGILLLTEPLTKYLKFAPRVIRSELAVSLAASIATAPVLLINFGSLSWISPLANLIILPLIPYAMLLGGVLLVFGFTQPISLFLLNLAEVVWNLLLFVLDLVNKYKLVTIVIFLSLLILYAISTKQKKI